MLIFYVQCVCFCLTFECTNIILIHSASFSQASDTSDSTISLGLGHVSNLANKNKNPKNEKNDKNDCLENKNDDVLSSTDKINNNIANTQINNNNNNNNTNNNNDEKNDFIDIKGTHVKKLSIDDPNFVVVNSYGDVDPPVQNNDQSRNKNMKRSGTPLNKKSKKKTASSLGLGNNYYEKDESKSFIYGLEAIVESRLSVTVYDSDEDHDDHSHSPSPKHREFHRTRTHSQSRSSMIPTSPDITPQASLEMLNT